MNKKMYVDVTEVCEDCGEGGCVCLDGEGSLEAAFLLCEISLIFKENIFCEKKLHKKYLMI